ncbi:flavin reductase [Brevibacterium album]|uniref:flavin reductase n=1 Tax=Brevibacterium album TaxID=417948 RepID=UPI000688054D|nr:flavin reductase [Brevibacterium album]
MSDFDSDEFRRVLGSFPTGVVVVTAANPAGEAVAMTVGSFVSVSLEPPLVAFLPQKTSSSWAALRASGTRFGVNILGNTQEDVCRAVAKRKTDKLEGFDWSLSAHGNPRLADAIAFIDCETQDVFDGGDHDIVVGRVKALETLRSHLPLLFFRGGYGSFRPGSMAMGTGISSARVAQLDRIRPHMERLANDLSTEITAMCMVDEDMVTVAAAGTDRRSARNHRVGRHVPFMPPIGGVFAAFGGPETEALWMSRIHDDADDAARRNFERGLEAVRESGYAFGIGHETGSAIEIASASGGLEPTGEHRRRLSAAINAASAHFNTAQVERAGEYEFHSATAPVFDRDGACVFSLTVWGPDGLSRGTDVLAVFDKLTRTAESCTSELRALAS